MTLSGGQVMAWVLNLLTVRVSVEELQPHVDADYAACILVLDGTFGLDRELTIMPIGAAHDANALDLLYGKGFDVLVGIAHQSQASNVTPVGEGDVPSIRL